MTEEIPSIPEFYRGRKVLITGGSGFMGRVLIEKLLRSCPELHTVYLLLRPKKNTQPSMRIQQLIDVPLFNRIRRECPHRLSKLVAVCGDVKELGLGLSEEDRRMLQDQVSVIFHSAASVRFDDPISDAILINVRGTREVINLALGMKDLKVMLHLSTTYCNFEHQMVYEQLYPPPGDWRKMIALVENSDNDHAIRALTMQLLGKKPNTYTYAKSLSEQVINEYKDKLPLVIVRPSIVTSTYREPMPGWVDNFNGPVGLMVAGGKGVLRSVHADPNNIGDYVPVDVAIRSIIFIAWHRALHSAGSDLPIYNCSTLTEPTTLYEAIELGKSMLDKYPMENIMWYRNPTITHNRHLHFLKVIFYHMLPALLIDGVLKVMGKKPTLVKLQRKIHIANMTLAVFTTHENLFDNSKFISLQTTAMKAEDVEAFAYNQVLSGKYEYVKAGAIGARVYLLKEPLSSLPQAMVHYRRMYWLDRFSKASILILLIWAFVPALVKTIAAICFNVWIMFS